MAKRDASILRGLALSLLLVQLPLVIVCEAQPPKSVSVCWIDLSALSAEWLTDCNLPDVDYYADFDGNRRVDLADFAWLAQHWLDPKVYAVAYDPYKGVQWGQWLRALAQHHDHMGRLSFDRILAYDHAGYNAIVPMDYAGKRSGGNKYCTYRLWPVWKYLVRFTNDEQVLSVMNSIKLFIPAMEEIGCDHMTSPFLTQYIELWEPNYCPVREPWHYETSQQCIDLINRYGGMAIIAHPTGTISTYMALNNFRGIEVFNAFYYEKWVRESKDPNSPEYMASFRTIWDHLLTYKSQKIWGFAVNDWFGPWVKGDSPWIDSGKIAVMIPSYDVNEYRLSLERGRFFAIFDWARSRHNKNRYPTINSIITDPNSIYIDTTGEVTWIANGRKVGYGPTINLTALPIESGYKYVRAEIYNENGMVFTQPWTLALLPKQVVIAAFRTDD